MSIESLEQFYQVVKEDLGLQEQLKAVTDRQEFLNKAVALGVQLGYQFSKIEMESKIKELEQHRTQGGELSESQLEEVSGGITTMSLFCGPEL